ncbi:protease inhibitor I42 family protein [Plantactinospora sp. S1510]|uniref:Protease inhibitor I42 family protein n=1 Tax=Plantactinospora alkalitolerans TaxID=2789879 RepID=A0ABS0H5R0_9ACTN|nr:protease inhibitor I42 family protein [Plantactinospora alkalitolerans]MBF9133795.1 protease inhibitor I42 family protein [Plantactinospora alkalitolerans]
MASPRRIVLIGAVLVVVLIAVVAVAGPAVRRHLRYGTVLDRQTTSATVDLGDRFSVRVPDRGASVGDDWTASADPADRVVLVGEERVSGSLLDRLFGPANGGGGGSRYFRFDAERAGQVTITVTNCFQGCRNDRTRAASETVTWTVTVS